MDPLSASSVPMRLDVRPGIRPDWHGECGIDRALEIAGLPATTPLRTIRLVREDGSVASHYVLAADALLAFQFQDGGPWARRIDHADYREWVDRWSSREHLSEHPAPVVPAASVTPDASVTPAGRADGADLQDPVDG